MKSTLQIVFLIFWIAVIFQNCAEKQPDTLFKLIPSDESGISFSNSITENDSINILQLEYIYNGGAVATGDFNNDGLTDIFFSGNQVSSKLYINKGNMQFSDATEKAGLDDTSKWRSGVALADINSDGLLDIYLCATIKKDSASRANMLYINKGIQNGIPVFEDQASQYGIADTGHSQYAAFLDYDLDGDLDLYVLTNTYNAKAPSAFREKIIDGSSPTTDRLYRNNGDQTFTNISAQAGITIEGYGLGLAIADFNNDRWPDIYVGNDYLTNDILYINNQNGTFTNRIDAYIKHQSQFSMGNDVADINNDALPDIITLDMLPEKNLRRKTVISGVNYVTYINAEKYGYAHQYVRNMLQLNNGNGTFSEIGQLAGIHQTEWSWSPLVADFDNDGHRDIMITNGFPKDVSDKDFGNYRSLAGKVSSVATMLDSIPVVKVCNYAYKNNGNLTFTDASKSWGIYQPAFSNGAAFADLDNDGDLDYVVNNINDPAFVYENTLYEQPEKKKTNHYLRIKLKGLKDNVASLGTKLTIQYGDGKTQYHDHSIYRGYLSTIEDVVHFGLGSDSIIHTLEVQWPDGKITTRSNVTSNQLLEINYADAKSILASNKKEKASATKTLFTKSDNFIRYKHEEDDKIDFNLQRTLPHKYSQYGPALAVADINGDQIDDLYIGGSANKPGIFYIQNTKGGFNEQKHAIGRTKTWEDLGVLLFDADGDGDNDLYTVSGSIEWQLGDSNYNDHLYLNDGKGNFSEATEALPALNSSGSCVRSADYDADGDLDLFVGGRVIPGKYPLAPESFILNNTGGKFVDVTSHVAKGLKTLGMVTDAIWSDFNGDGKTDLIVVGELMPVTFYLNTGEVLQDITNEAGTKDLTGWWNSITAADFDHDGDIDYAAGNLGQNHYYKASQERPVKIFAKDFDGNGSIDPIIACSFLMENGKSELCPVHFWDELNALSPRFRRQFSRYKEYGKATIDDLLSPEDLQDATVITANHPATSYFENLGNNKFKAKTLPVQSQVSTVNGMIANDFNDDGNADILLIGNDYGNEVFSGRLDASIGLLLQGDGKGNFISLKPTQSGFEVKGDGKALCQLYTRDLNELTLASQNKDSLKIFTRADEGPLFEPQTKDTKIEFKLKDNSVVQTEIYYGSGFLSQSSRKVKIPTGTVELRVTNSKNETRSIKGAFTGRKIFK